MEYRMRLTVFQKIKMHTKRSCSALLCTVMYGCRFSKFCAFFLSATCSGEGMENKYNREYVTFLTSSIKRAREREGEIPYSFGCHWNWILQITLKHENLCVIKMYKLRTFIIYLSNKFTVFFFFLHASNSKRRNVWTSDRIKNNNFFLFGETAKKLVDRSMHLNKLNFNVLSFHTPRPKQIHACRHTCSQDSLHA